MVHVRVVHVRVYAKAHTVRSDVRPGDLYASIGSASRRRLVSDLVRPLALSRVKPSPFPRAMLAEPVR